MIYKHITASIWCVSLVTRNKFTIFPGNRNHFLSCYLIPVTHIEDFKLSFQCNFASYRLYEAGIAVYNRLALMDTPDSTPMRSWDQISFRKIGHKRYIFLFMQNFDVNIAMITQNKQQPHTLTSVS